MFKSVFLLSLCAGVAALQTHLKAKDTDHFFDGSESMDLSSMDFSIGSLNAASVAKQVRVNWVRRIQQYTFEQFVVDYQKEYLQDAKEYARRSFIFQQRRNEAVRLASTDKLWWFPGLNKFLDYTKEEFNFMLGYKPNRKNSAGVQMYRQPKLTQEEVDFKVPDDWEPPSTGMLDWRPNMTYAQDFQKDQGACGSCWATATNGALEAYAAIFFGKSVPLSDQQLVSCTPNPKHCGGTGGCEGATAELALDYILSNGGQVFSEADYGYTSFSGEQGTCMDKKLKANPVLTVSSYVNVPSNSLRDTMHALESGPVIIAVAADTWALYGGGIFNSCGKDATLNHAVVLVGYGKDAPNWFSMEGGENFLKNDPAQDRGYWLIRNSWGTDWGENGYIKLARSLSAKTAAGSKAPYCGMDTDPQAGSACEGETDPIKVCGMCGILYEPVLPKVSAFKEPSNFNSIIEKAQAKLTKVHKSHISPLGGRIPTVRKQ